jgi:hypothetical protein
VSHAYLSKYLNDHLAGADAALEILAALQRLDSPALWRPIESEIREDRAELERLMHIAGAPSSPIRQATAWTAEKLAELKMRVDDPSSGALRRLELMDALAMGIEGKRALWMALQRAALRQPTLANVDYERLIARADAQRLTVEERRLTIAEDALSAA